MTQSHPTRSLRNAVAGLALALGAVEAATAQDLDRLQPKPLIEAAPMQESQDEQATVSANEGRDEVLLESLRGLVLLQSPDNLNADGIALSGVISEGYQPSDLFASMQRFLGQPVSLAQLDEIVREIVLSYRRANSPVVDAYVPNQDITSGTVQVVIVEGKVGQVRVEGNRWFKQDQILSQFDLEENQTVKSDQVSKDLDWINRNPFRHVDLVLARGSEPGTTDVILQTRDRLPLRVYAGYENTGTTETGEDRVQLGLNWGNAFNQGHLLDYQYTGSMDHKKLQAHAVRYTAMLPWRHTALLNISYSRSEPELGPFDLDATSYAALGRYIVPLGSGDSYEHRFLAGFDYKFSDSNLEFAEIPVFGKRVQVLQFSAGYGMSLQDRLGATSWGGQFVYSPGDLIKDNSDRAFGEQRDGSSSEYAYLDLNATRQTRLPQEFTLRSRANLKFSDDLLIGSEQFGLGGNYSVRGFDERELNGDVGFFFSNELVTPDLSSGRWFGWDSAETDLRAHVFYDYGYAQQKGARRFHLSSAGFGLRFQWRSNVSLTMDYGWQLTGKDIDPERDAKGHIGATVSY